jgi:hypothetical protein
MSFANRSHEIPLPTQILRNPKHQNHCHAHRSKRVAPMPTDPDDEPSRQMLNAFLAEVYGELLKEAQSGELEFVYPLEVAKLLNRWASFRGPKLAKPWMLKP